MSSQEPPQPLTADTGQPQQLSLYQSVRMGLALIFYRTPGRVKRPASHKWLIAVSCFVTLVLVRLLGGMMRKPDRVQYLFDQWLTLFVMFMGPFILLVMLAGGRRKWAYYLASAGLSVLTLRGLQTLLMVRMFGVAKSVGVETLIMGEVMVGGMVYLWWRVALGEPSRRYFGMIEASEEHEAPPADATDAAAQEAPERHSDLDSDKRP